MPLEPFTYFTLTKFLKWFFAPHPPPIFRISDEGPSFLFFFHFASLLKNFPDIYFLFPYSSLFLWEGEQDFLGGGKNSKNRAPRNFYRTLRDTYFATFFVRYFSPSHRFLSSVRSCICLFPLCSSLYLLLVEHGTRASAHPWETEMKVCSGGTLHQRIQFIRTGHHSPLHYSTLKAFSVFIEPKFNWNISNISLFIEKNIFKMIDASNFIMSDPDLVF